eukprot:gene2417-2721_t
MVRNKEQADLLRGFTDSLRSRGGLDYSTAKVATYTPNGEEYVWHDYVRVKDVVKLLKSQQQLLDEHTRPQATALVVLGVLAATLFPLAPYAVRLAVLYFLTGLLSLMLGTMLLRYVLWVLVWLVTGAHFWLFPNMMSETVPITELFSPAVSYAAAAPEDRSSSLLLRGAALLLLGGAGYALWAKGPDAATVSKNMQGARDSVLNYFAGAGQPPCGGQEGLSGLCHPW